MKIMAIQYPNGIRTIITNVGLGISADKIDGIPMVGKQLMEVNGRYKVISGTPEQCKV